MGIAEKRLEASVNWQSELNKVAERYHRIGAWVAIIFNTVFFITDYINIHEYWTLFLIVRLVVSGITLLTLLLRKPLQLSTSALIFVPFLLISIQNAFMWSLMDAEHLQKHTLAYIALFIGSGMLILWRMYYSIIVVVVSLAANIIFFYFDSELTIEEDLANGGLLTFTVAVFSIILIQTRYDLTKKEIIARLALKEANANLEIQKGLVEEKNNEVTKSIRYAQRIQEAILPENSTISKHLPEHFVLFKPRDIVSGDFYWFDHIDGKSIVAVADCTGHGVPGAFMSMIGNTLMNKIIAEGKNTDPADILFEMRHEIIASLKQTERSEPKDGMDVALCIIDHAKKELHFSGAFNPLILVQKGIVRKIKGSRMPVGFYYDKNDTPYESHSISYEQGDSFYIMSDGFADQFGGKNDRKFGAKRFRDLVESIQSESMELQKARLEEEHQKWKKSTPQLDDILIIGAKLL